MSTFLKQSTAFVQRMGPFISEADSISPLTGLTIAQADIQISKNGGAFAQTSDAAPTTTHDTDGHYQIPLTVTDTDTVGPLTVQIHVTGALPVVKEFTVVPASVYAAIVEQQQSVLTASVLQPSAMVGKTRLDAVNEIIGQIGQYPVATLDTGGSSDAALAETILNRVNIEIQSCGWYCNTEKNVTLALAADKTIPLANNLLKVDPCDESLNYCRRGITLYDLDNHTDKFTGAVDVNTVKLLNFEDLPPSLKDYIVAAASVQFQVERVGSSKVHAFTLQKRDETMLKAHQENTMLGDYSILNTHIAREVRGVPYGPVLVR